MIKIAINGFGRIGRLTFRNLFEREEVEIVAVNDLADAATLVHLLKYDSVHGKLKERIDIEGNTMKVGGKSIEILSERDPSKLPWKEMQVDVVLECTGIFRDKEGMNKHIEAGAKKVLLSAPAKGDIKTIVLGVNDHILKTDDYFVSNASCTTNCLAPMVKILHDNFGVEKGSMTTVHAYTADQRLQDAPHRDLRRARAAALSIIPTSTGAAQAVGLVLPELNGKLNGMAMRVPIPSGSVVDLTAVLCKEVSRDEINGAVKRAAEGPMKGIVWYSDEPLVSADIVGDTHSCIFDSKLTSVEGNLVKVIGWYDNEAGYSARLADLAVRLISGPSPEG